MIAPMTRAPPGNRADYHRFLAITTRWMDNDVFGHLNNVVYYSFFDTAVTHSLMESGILTWKGGDHFLVVAESGCRYHAEAAFPEAMTAGIRVARLGGSSIRHEIGMFAGDNGRASAEGFMVHVCVDAATRRPAPMPDAWREALQSIIAKRCNR
jgi:acyl-CoA thioester hydrolase